MKKLRPSFEVEKIDIAAGYCSAAFFIAARQATRYLILTVVGRGRQMFTFGAFAAVVVIGWYVSRDQDRDPHDTATNIRHSRQDLRLIAYILFAILIALGIIADRIH